MPPILPPTAINKSRNAVIFATPAIHEFHIEFSTPPCCSPHISALGELNMPLAFRLFPLLQTLVAVFQISSLLYIHCTLVLAFVALLFWSFFRCILPLSATAAHKLTSNTQMVKLFKNLHNTIAQNKFVIPNFEVVLSSRRRHALVRTSFQPWIA